jgi:hypothetical protein
MDDVTRDQLLEQIERNREEMANLRADQLDVRVRLQRLELAGLDLERRLATLDAKLVRLGQQLDRECEQSLDGREAASRG